MMKSGQNIYEDEVEVIYTEEESMDTILMFYIKMNSLSRFFFQFISHIMSNIAFSSVLGFCTLANGSGVSSHLILINIKKPFSLVHCLRLATFVYIALYYDLPAELQHCNEKSQRNVADDEELKRIENRIAINCILPAVKNYATILFLRR